MPRLPTRYDVAYAALLAAASPVLLVRPALRRKTFEAVRLRDGRVPTYEGHARCVAVHGVSVGEVNAARPLVERLRERGSAVCVAATTHTGFARAVDLYGDDPAAGVWACRYPVDTSAAVGRFLDNTRARAVVAMELEVWPNLAAVCRRRGVPLVVANGRVTERSFRRYLLARPVLGRTFGRVSLVLAQDEVYAERFRGLGVPGGRVRVAGSLKYDAAPRQADADAAAALARAVGLTPRSLGGKEAVVVGGSTGPGEEALLLDALAAWRRDVPDTPDVRLVLVPRQPGRFDEVADLVRSRGLPLVRRSAPQPTPGGVVLIDTLGELRHVWPLADVAVVGRSLVDLGERQHGSDLLEPAGMGLPVVHGPYMTNFAEPTARLAAAGATRVASTPHDLVRHVGSWLADPAGAAEAGATARRCVDAGRGTADVTAAAVAQLLG